jgi:predicted PurR-regulated permease PerM
MYPYDWQRSIVVTAYLLIAVVAVGAMYWAQAVFIPLALAMLLTLVLAPLVATLQRIGFGRTPAVVLVVALTAGLTCGLGWIVTRQFVQLAYELPGYSDTIKAKVRSLRELAAGPSTGRLGRLFDEISSELQSAPLDAKKSASAPVDRTSPPSTGPSQPGAENSAQPQPVVVAPESPAWFTYLTAALGSLGDALATFGLAVVLTIFMLIHRERLRDRLILLIGHGRLTATTKAFDEAVHRISRFLLMQLLVNGSYGMALAAGLLLLGVPYALLWGLLAALLRYIPYLGAWIAALPPVLVSFVMSEGWTQPLLVVGWIILIELVSNNIIEPLLYGHSMGVSTVALLVAAAFWTFLWGPIGLVLSSPLTVCLVVLGKYVPQLKFIDILLGDEPALKPHESFYQRLLARDSDEARQIAMALCEALPPRDVFDALVVPALSYFKRDAMQNLLSDRDERYLLRALREIIAELGEQIQKAAGEAAGARDASDLPSPCRRVRLLACPADGEADEIALEMLAQLLDPARWELEIASDEVLAAELLETVAHRNVSAVCIGSIPPNGLAHSRYFCKRLRSYRADVKVVVGRWGSTQRVKQTEEQLRAAGADEVAWSLVESSKQLDSWWPVLAERSLVSA